MVRFHRGEHVKGMRLPVRSRTPVSPPQAGAWLSERTASQRINCLTLRRWYSGVWHELKRAEDEVPLGSKWDQVKRSPVPDLLA